MKNISTQGIIGSLVTIGLTIPLLWFLAWGFITFECNGVLAVLIIISILDFVLLTFASIGLIEKFKARKTIISNVDAVKESEV